MVDTISLFEWKKNTKKDAERVVILIVVVVVHDGQNDQSYYFHFDKTVSTKWQLYYKTADSGYSEDKTKNNFKKLQLAYKMHEVFLTEWNGLGIPLTFSYTGASTTWEQRRLEDLKLYIQLKQLQQETWRVSQERIVEIFTRQERSFM